jgi:hypothetical protein
MKTYELGAVGLAFLESLLDRGDQVAEAVRSEKLAQGRMFTFMPDSADPKKVSLIEGSREFCSDDNSNLPIKLIIAEHLQGSNKVFVMELDSTTREAAFRLYAGKTFQFFISAAHYHTFVNGEGQAAQEELVGVYGYVRRPDEDFENVQDLILYRRAFGAIGILSCAAELPSNGGVCDPAILTEVAANT